MWRTTRESYEGNNVTCTAQYYSTTKSPRTRRACVLPMQVGRLPSQVEYRPVGEPLYALLCMHHIQPVDEAAHRVFNVLTSSNLSSDCLPVPPRKEGVHNKPMEVVCDAANKNIRGEDVEEPVLLQNSHV